jgi:His/Glu/Gln/Arg/opine family amino acid ABC transporter permease subunit
MKLDPFVIIDNWRLIAEGFLTTVAICLVAAALGFALGIVLALIRLSRVKVLALIVTAYIEVFRNIPFLIQVFLLYYGLPFYGLMLPAWLVGTVALTLYAGAYYSEVVRGAINSVAKGQLESARAVGMSRLQAMRHVIFPQMLAYFVPPAANQTMSLVKESALLSTITVTEMTMAALRIQGIAFSPFEVLITIALLYWAINATLGWSMSGLQLRLQPYRRPRPVAVIAAPAPLVGRRATAGE